MVQHPRVRFQLGVKRNDEVREFIWKTPKRDKKIISSQGLDLCASHET